ncbi:transposase family protein [Dactylosporangium cerinum]|uniref:Transposase family protein n=1 Tax=Dactylosporangium cerinum TaxID=1434730 RepID=A0ABV9W287_9ACTN
MRDAVGQLLPHLDGVEIDEAVDVGAELVVAARVRSRQAGCQACAVPSSRVHSRYRRTLADAPVAGRPIRIVLSVRRFFYDNSASTTTAISDQVARSRRAGRRR